VERRLAAILAADVVGYSRLMGVDEEGTWCCQTNANQSQFAPTGRISGGAELTPLSQCGGAVQLEVCPAV
jgi:class 3 adenylate cyclase